MTEPTPEIVRRMAEAIQDQLDGDTTTSGGVAFREHFGERAARAVFDEVGDIVEAARRDALTMAANLLGGLDLAVRIVKDYRDAPAVTFINCSIDGTDPG